jgi:hypothetical protein
MSVAECRSIENGIWLCDIHAREIDDNWECYRELLLKQWRNGAEKYVESLVTQDARLRQLRAIVMPALSTLRILGAFPGPGPKLDQTFFDAGQIPLWRLLIEVELLLFENGFFEESKAIKRIAEEFIGTVIPAIQANKPDQFLPIGPWKDRVVGVVMLKVMKYDSKAFEHYREVEADLVKQHQAELPSWAPNPTIRTDITLA